MLLVLTGKFTYFNFVKNNEHYENSNNQRQQNSKSHTG